MTKDPPTRRGDQANDHVPHGTRRQVVTACTAAVWASIAGCAGRPSTPTAPPDPISLLGGKQCDVCGMVVEDHPGPNGQIFYRDHAPETHDNPAWFESLRACLFPYYFEKERLDWTVDAVYVTDYSSVDYEVEEIEGDTYITAFTEPETFADATGLTFVVGSTVFGSMGPEFVPFSGEADAEAFVDEHGGELVDFGEIDPGMLGR